MEAGGHSIRVSDFPEAVAVNPKTDTVYVANFQGRHAAARTSSNCACAQPGHRGHGPQHNLTRRVGGKTLNTHLRPGPELDKAGREVAEHQRFLGLVEEVSEVSEAICAARPATGAAPPPAEGERGGSRRRSRRSPPRR